MKIATAIKRALKATNWTQARLADALGITSQSVIAQRFRNKDMEVSTVLEMLDAIGYELILQPKPKNGKHADNAIVITKEDDPA